MIAQLKGILSSKSSENIIVDVQGVGYEVMISKSTFQHLPEAGENISILIHTHVTESSLTLFGFLNTVEKSLFKHLISVNGIGPRLATQILSGMTSFELIQSLIDKNLSRLTSISGIGKKTAERLIIELHDKVLKIADPTLTPASAKGVHTVIEKEVYHETLSALINLGYNRSIAEKILARVEIPRGSRVEDILKKSLTELAP